MQQSIEQLTIEFPEQLRKAVAIAQSATLTAATQPIHNIVVAGMGGSAIGASLVQAFTFNELKVPISIIRTYEMPPIVGPNTLFVAASYSGNTEETYACLEAAISAGAKITAITSGGKVGAAGKQHGFDVVNIPGDANCPRASIGYSFVQLLTIFYFHGLTNSDHLEELTATANQIETGQEAIKTTATEMAQSLTGKLPVIYSDAKFEGVALRTQQQINENSKQFAHMNTFPEMNHNELVGWEKPDDLWPKAVVMMLQTDYDHPRARIRMDICQKIFEERANKVYVVKAQGPNMVAQLIYLIHLVDWVSFYLSAENGVEPFPIDVINYLKGELAKV